MRLQTTITELAPEQWVLAQKVLRTEYKIPENASRVCLTLEHQGEDRHVEMQVGTYIGLLASLGLTSLANAIEETMSAMAPVRIEVDK